VESKTKRKALSLATLIFSLIRYLPVNTVLILQVKPQTNSSAAAAGGRGAGGGVGGLVTKKWRGMIG
jgi:hypothetical protein